MNFEINPASLQDKAVLRQLMELYAYDFSEFDGADVDEHGMYGYSYLDHYWTEEGRYALLFRADGKLAGFAMVRRVEVHGEPVWSMAEFFVMRKYRQHGLGRDAACRIFELFPGRWNVAELAENAPAQAFWRRIISEYTGGAFTETWQNDEHWQGPVQEFVSNPAEKAG
ncbi:MAG: GNAT family N-acetyltransferase [Anaerolineaceae bacterium]